MIRILLVEDSPVQRLLLADILGREDDFDVVGTACDGEEAVHEADRLRPDLILMDFHMPKLNGALATRRIMEECPTPIVICSATLVPGDLEPGFEALRRGALAVVQKPTAPDATDFDALANALVRTVRLMAEVRVVRRWPQRMAVEAATATPQPPARRRCRMLAIGGSTGAPGVVAEILTALAPVLTVPVLIVQHMSPGFVEGFARWLGETSRVPVTLARQGVQAQPGHAYVGPDGHHLGIDPGGILRLSQAPPDHGFRPSVSHLMRSLATAYGAAGTGVILSGMGMDGADGLAQLRAAGGLTLAQDRTTSIVFGMPSEAINRNAVMQVLAPPALAEAIAANLPVKEPSR